MKKWGRFVLLLGVILMTPYLMAGAIARVIQIRVNSSSTSSVPQGTLITFKDGSGIDFTRSGFQITATLNGPEAWSAVDDSVLVAAKDVANDSLNALRPTLVGLASDDSTLAADLLALQEAVDLEDSTLTADKATYGYVDTLEARLDSLIGAL